MKNILKQLMLLILSIQLLIGLGCKKDFLDEKPSTNILQPVKLEEYQQLLDNTEKINTSVGLGVLSADEYKYSSDATWLSARTPLQRNSYIWASDLYEGDACLHWNLPYSSIFYANNVLQGLDNIALTRNNENQWKNIKGWALFIRAFAYYDLVKDFSATYDESTAKTDLGVPLRLNPSIAEIQPRATVEATYQRIFADLEQASGLLTDLIATVRSRPSKAAAHALLARIYLNTRQYQKAETHADSALLNYNTLIDYNSLNKVSQSPFPYNHPEQIYAKTATSEAAYATTTSNTYIQMDEELMALYEAEDLRLAIYFTKQADGTYDMKRGYYGPTLYPYTGLATDELFLIKAETAARRKDSATALSFLNQLLVKRYVMGKYKPIVAIDGMPLLRLIINERRKELVWRGTRWDDIKRLNKEGENITLNRIIDGNSYTLKPLSPKYVFPIPDNEIVLGGLIQNKR